MSTTVWTPRGDIVIKERWKEDLDLPKALHDKMPGQLEPNLRCFVKGPLTVLVGSHPQTGRWHASVNHPSRYPTWAEIKEVRYTFGFGDDIWMGLMLPPQEHYINVAPNCFHLYEIDRPLEV